MRLTVNFASQPWFLKVQSLLNTFLEFQVLKKTYSTAVFCCLPDGKSCNYER